MSASDRYVVLGLARARSEWFRTVARWANAAALPVEFVKCVSPRELETRLRGGRRFSAALLDGELAGVDRDLLACARQQGCAVLIVQDHDQQRWHELGAAAVLSPALNRDQLLEALSGHASTISEADPGRAEPARRLRPPGGRLLAVTGAGGVGASTVAIALAQELASAGDQRHPGRGVLLADLCRWADQAMLHDARRLVPSIQELVEAHRSRTPSAAEVREQTLRVEERGYRLLLGLRRPRHWVALRPAALEATISSLQRAFRVVVCDIEPDLEGEETSGSLDLEERNLMARLTAARAELVVAVGSPGMKGLFSLVRVIGALVDFGVPPLRIVPVVNRAPRGPAARSELAGGLQRLLSPSLQDAELAGPLFLPERRVETALRDGVELPAPLGGLLVGAVEAARQRAGHAPHPAATGEPQRITPGTLGDLAPTEPPHR